MRVDVEVGRSGGPGMARENGIERFFRRPLGFGLSETRPPSGRGVGSGFLIDRSGNIVTNSHVVAKATKVTVVFSPTAASCRPR